MILIIDDDAAFCALLDSYLLQRGYETARVDSGEAAIELMQRGGGPEIDLALLDIGLPGMNGFQTIRRLRQSSSLPLIILSANSDNSSRLLGLELGADDYVAKQTDPEELAARIAAVLRRTRGQGAGPNRGEQLEVEDIVLSPQARKVTVAGRVVNLTGFEFDMLWLFLRNAGKVLSKDDVSQCIFGRSVEPFSRSIDVHISRLRFKLGNRRSGRRRIEGIRGKGYVLLVGD